MDAVRVGALGPLSPPGVVWGGRELEDGLRLGVERVNAESAGRGGRPIELAFRDSGGIPEAGVAAATELIREGAVALVGEYHSVVAEAVARHADSMAVPFLCASATLDAITARRSPWVFRLAPPQSYGWAVYADFLHGRGFQEVVAIVRPDLYWSSGAAVLEHRLAQLGVGFIRLEFGGSLPEVVSRLESMAAGGRRLVVLLLVGYPQPTGALVTALHERGLFPGRVALGHPAGPCAFPDWWEVAGPQGVDVSFLCYLDPGSLPEAGRAFARSFNQRYGREPTFVAFEGFDSALALGHAVAAAGSATPSAIRASLAHVEFQGARGSVRFSTEPDGVVHQQWRWPPVCVVSHPHPHASPSQVDVLWRASS